MYINQGLIYYMIMQKINKQTALAKEIGVIKNSKKKAKKENNVCTEISKMIQYWSSTQAEYTNFSPFPCTAR